MMRKILVAVAVSVGLTGPALAADKVLVGDAAAGKAKTAACVACHGVDGNSPAPSFPKLAGQSERYLTKQLHDIKSGVRPVPTMVGMTEQLTDQDIADIAAYFAAQEASIGQAKKDLVAKGELIYRGGLREKGVPACAACHSPSGVGNAPAGFPRLGGQYADYVVVQLKAYRAAQDGDATGRSNDGDNKPMRSIAARLSDSEIAAVASYIAGLH
jgi:cytochrome c553